MFYLLNQKFADDVRATMFKHLYRSIYTKLDELDINSHRSVFDEIIEILEELKVQATSHSVNKTHPITLSVVPAEEVKF